MGSGGGGGLLGSGRGVIAPLPEGTASTGEAEAQGLHADRGGDAITLAAPMGSRCSQRSAPLNPPPPLPSFERIKSHILEGPGAAAGLLCAGNDLVIPLCHLHQPSSLGKGCTARPPPPTPLQKQHEEKVLDTPSPKPCPQHLLPGSDSSMLLHPSPSITMDTASGRAIPYRVPQPLREMPPEPASLAGRCFRLYTQHQKSPPLFFSPHLSLPPLLFFSFPRCTNNGAKRLGIGPIIMNDVSLLHAAHPLSPTPAMSQTAGGGQITGCLHADGLLSGCSRRGFKTVSDAVCQLKIRDPRE